MQSGVHKDPAQWRTSAGRGIPFSKEPFCQGCDPRSLIHVAKDSVDKKARAAVVTYGHGSRARATHSGSHPAWQQKRSRGQTFGQHASPSLSGVAL